MQRIAVLLAFLACPAALQQATAQESLPEEAVVWSCDQGVDFSNLVSGRGNTVLAHYYAGSADRVGLFDLRTASIQGSIRSAGLPLAVEGTRWLLATPTRVSVVDGTTGKELASYPFALGAQGPAGGWFEGDSLRVVGTAGATCVPGAGPSALLPPMRWTGRYGHRMLCLSPTGQLSLRALNGTVHWERAGHWRGVVLAGARILAFDSSSVVELDGATGGVLRVLLTDAQSPLQHACLEPGGDFLLVLDEDKGQNSLHRIDLRPDSRTAIRSFRMAGVLGRPAQAMVATEDFLVIPTHSQLVVINPLAFATPTAVQADGLLLYRQHNWVHIGDGDFSPESTSAHRLKIPNSGPRHELPFFLTEKQRTALAGFSTGELHGSVIGLDYKTSVRLNGTAVGSLTREGTFRLSFDPAILVQDGSNLLVFEAGSDGSSPDDQEIGDVEIWLTGSIPAE